MDLGPVETDRAELQHARLLREQKYLYKEIFQF